MRSKIKAINTVLPTIKPNCLVRVKSDKPKHRNPIQTIKPVVIIALPT